MTQKELDLIERLIELKIEKDSSINYRHGWEIENDLDNIREEITANEK